MAADAPPKVDSRPVSHTGHLRRAATPGVLAGELHELISGWVMQIRGAYDAAGFRIEGFPGDPQEQDRRSPAYRGVLTRTADGIAGDLIETFTAWPIHVTGTRDGDGYALTGRLGAVPEVWRVPYLDDPSVVVEPGGRR